MRSSGRMLSQKPLAAGLRAPCQVLVKYPTEGRPPQALEQLKQQTQSMDRRTKKAKTQAVHKKFNTRKPRLTKPQPKKSKSRKLNQPVEALSIGSPRRICHNSAGNCNTSQTNSHDEFLARGRLETALEARFRASPEASQCTCMYIFSHAILCAGAKLQVRHL